MYRTMIQAGLLAAMMVLLCTVSSTEAGNYTITDEAWFSVTVEDPDTPTKNYSGRFVIALFGETVPMTVMNFVAITRGYERPNQVYDGHTSDVQPSC